MKEKLVLDDDEEIEYSGPSDVQVQSEWDKILDEYGTELHAFQTRSDQKRGLSIFDISLDILFKLRKFP